MTEEELSALVDGIAPVVRECVARAVSELTGRLLVTDTELAAVRGAVGDLASVRERLAVLETRPQLAGPAGQDGAPGPPGNDGAPGTPGLEYRGVFVDGHTYDRGQLVTSAGATWHCNEATTSRPGDRATAWTLMVKRGRDGKDGAAGPQGPAGKDWQQVFDDQRRR